MKIRRYEVGRLALERLPDDSCACAPITDRSAVPQGHEKTLMWFQQAFMSKDATGLQGTGENIQVPNNEIVHNWTSINSLGHVEPNSVIQKREIQRA